MFTSCWPARISLPTRPVREAFHLGCPAGVRATAEFGVSREKRTVVSYASGRTAHQPSTPFYLKRVFLGSRGDTIFFPRSHDLAPDPDRSPGPGPGVLAHPGMVGNRASGALV